MAVLLAAFVPWLATGEFDAFGRKEGGAVPLVDDAATAAATAVRIATPPPGNGWDQWKTLHATEITAVGAAASKAYAATASNDVSDAHTASAKLTHCGAIFPRRGPLLP